jgi:hypothetical protein
MKIALLTAVFVCALVWSSQASVLSLDDAVRENRGSVVYIKVQKVNSSNGAITEVEGTGFVVSKAGLVITSDHVVSASGGIDVDVRGAISSREGTLEGMEVIYENSNFDVAVLRFKNTAIVRKPVEVGDPWTVSDAATVYAMGFPSREEWFHTEGKLSGKGGPKGSWNTTLVLNPGMSGGPIFTNEGKVVAIVWGGVPTPGIVGISRIIPVNLLTEPLRLAGIAAAVSAPVSLPPTTAPTVIQVTYNIDAAQDSLGGFQAASRDYQRVFEAREGFKIKDYTLVSKSANNASITSSSVSQDGKTLTVTFSLKSGPVFDRWRGWLDVDILTRQEPNNAK